MLNTRENIRFVNFDAFIVLSILLFGILIYNNSRKTTTELNRKHVSAYISMSENNAVSNSPARLQIFQKTWVSNKDHFNLLAFNRNPQSENKKTDIKVSHLRIIRQSSNKIPQFILSYHLFPSETDEPPLLG
jgi:hypothetical protein